MMPPRHNLTRRALLGAGVGACATGDMYSLHVPISQAGAGAAGGGHVQVHVPSRFAALHRRWHRALAAYRRAEARLEALRRHIDGLPPAQRAFPACEPVEDRYDDLESARLARLRRLLAAPAPDLAALALKIELAIDDQAWELSSAQTSLAALKSDARRLADRANSSA